MLYGLVQNGQVVKSLPYINDEIHPGLRSGMTSEELEAFNIYPIDESLPEGYDEKIHHIENHALVELTFDVENKIIKGFKTFYFKSLDELYNNKLEEINKIREEKIHENIHHSVLNGGSVQVRNTQDMMNLNGLMSDALYSKINNISKTHNFIDAENNIHILTSDQVIEMCTFVKNQIELVYAQSWNVKFVELKAIYDNNSLTLENKLNQIANYIWS